MTDEKDKTGEEAVEAIPEEAILYCQTCKVRKFDHELEKLPLGYSKAEDGSTVSDNTRFTVLCKECKTLLTVIDPDAVKALDDMKKERS